MNKSCGTVVSVVTQRRRNRQFVAMHVAPKCPRPQALRDLYLDAGTRIRSGGVSLGAEAPAEHEAESEPEYQASTSPAASSRS